MLHTIAAIENLPQGQLEQAVEQLNSLGPLSVKNIQEYTDLRATYRSLAATASSIDSPYRSLTPKIKLLRTLDRQFSVTDRSLLTQASQLRRLDLADKEAEVHDLATALENIGQHNHASELKNHLDAFPRQQQQYIDRIENHEQRLQELQHQYNRLAAHSPDHHTFPEARKLSTHAATFSEQAEQLRDEVEDRHHPLLSRAASLAENADQLESAIQEYSDEARRHTHKRMGWLAAKIGSGVLLLGSACLQFGPDIYQLYQTYTAEQERPTLPPEPPSLPTRAELPQALTPREALFVDLKEQDVKYVLYIDRATRHGQLHDLRTDTLLLEAPATLAKYTGEKQYQGDGRTQSGIFKIETANTMPRNRLYGTGFINLEDKPFVGMQVVGAGLDERIQAIYTGNDSTNGAVAFLNKDIQYFIDHIAAHGKENGRVVIEDPRRPLR